MRSLAVVLVAIATVNSHSEAVNVPCRHLPSGPVVALRQDFHQVAIRVLDKSEAFHATAVRRLVELDTHCVEALTCIIHIRHGHAEVAKSAPDRLAIFRAGRVGVTRVVDLARGLRLAAMIPGELDAAWSAHAQGKSALVVIRDDYAITDWRDEVDTEAPLWKVIVPEELHTQHLSVKVERLDGVLNTDHRLLHHEAARLRGLWSGRVPRHVGHLRGAHGRERTSREGDASARCREGG
mmetsp:Transcript_9376/g.24254  ORF Transcript_9376/g.24254 Transcript_9376/m.24254 type:complete len:238 (+) Transcript_9376:219-932(+)